MRLKELKYDDINQYNTHINNLNGIFQVTAANLAIPFITIFAKRLSATDYQVALLSSLPAIISVGAIIPGAFYIQRHNDKKNITGKFFILARFFYFLFALVPLISGSYRASLFVLLYGLMNLPGSIALSAWQSFIAGLFPPHMRAGVLAKRNRISTLLGIVITLFTGFILYNIPKTDEQRLLFYQMFFLLAFLFSIAEIYIFFKYREPVNEKDKSDETHPADKNQMSFKSTFSSIKSNKRFLSYCAAALVFHFAWYMPAPLFPLYEIDHLHSNEMWTSINSALTAIFSATAYPYWGKFIGKKGNGLPLALSAVLMGLVPSLYPHIHSLYALMPVCMLGGIAQSGISLVLLNTLYDVSVAQYRNVYIAVFNTMTNFLLIFAPFVGIWLKNDLGVGAGFTIAGFLRVSAGLLFFYQYIRGQRKSQGA